MNIDMVNIGFSFDEVPVLENVNFSVHGGEIHALLGENGAGKSTLMNILGGVLPLQKGKTFVDSKEVKFKTPNDSLKYGIGFIHQELNLFNDLTVYENLFISNFLQKGPILDRKEMISKTRELFSKLEIDIDPKAVLSSLSVSEKQIVEISRSLLFDAKIIIMDEPTTSLTFGEIEKIFAICRKLRDNGVGIIFISHKLNEVFELCDSYTVMRNGVVVDNGLIKDTTIGEISEKLVGHVISQKSEKRSCVYGEEILSFKNFGDDKHFKNINISVKEGQILGITGLLGDGRNEIIAGFLGINGEKYKGEIYYSGKIYKPCGTKHLVQDRIAYLPSNRNENGILKTLSIFENGSVSVLPKYKKFLFIDKKSLLKEFMVHKEDLRIKLNKISDPITSLSGGNQQKVIFLRMIETTPKLLILDNPTQGVDIGAKAEIAEKVRSLADMGMAVIWLSPDSIEISNYCDNAYVLFQGEVRGFLEGEALNQVNIMNLAVGGRLNE